jgi:hypothetical protein
MVVVGRSAVGLLVVWLSDGRVACDGPRNSVGCGRYGSGIYGSVWYVWCTIPTHHYYGTFD